MNLRDILPELTRYHSQHKSIVLVTGVFDILHQEHIIFLKKARAVGDVLVVGIESDQRVSQIKGDDRPIHHQQVRLDQIRKLRIADLVFILPENFSTPNTHEQLISQIKPNILAVSSHTNHLDKKDSILRKYGGRVKIVHQHNPQISTTNLIKRAQ